MKKWRIVLLLVILVGVIIIIKSNRNSIMDLSQTHNINIRAFSIWTRITRIICIIGVFAYKYRNIRVWCDSRFITQNPIWCSKT